MSDTEVGSHVDRASKEWPGLGPFNQIKHIRHICRTQHIDIGVTGTFEPLPGHLHNFEPTDQPNRPRRVVGIISEREFDTRTHQFGKVAPVCRLQIGWIRDEPGNSRRVAQNPASLHSEMPMRSA